MNTIFYLMLQSYTCNWPFIASLHGHKFVATYTELFVLVEYFIFKIMGINRELAFCKSFQLSGKADTRASVRSGMMDSSSWFIPNLFNGSDSVNHFFMDLALCTGACHTDRKAPYFTVNVCLRKLYGCMLDFMHLFIPVKGVSKTDKSSN